MKAPRTLLLASAAALLSVPAWAASSAAAPGHGHGSAGTPPGQTKDADEHGSSTGGHPGTSHRCKPHGVAFILSGTLEKQTLVKNSDGTYSGEIALESVKRTNHHAKGAKGPFTVTSTHVTLRVSDINSDGTVGIDDVVKGDNVKLIGKITTLAKKCDSTGFTATITVRRAIFSSPTTP